MINTIALLLSLAFAQDGTQDIKQFGQDFMSKIRLEINAGATNFGVQPNGTWYQDGFPYHLALQSAEGGIGFVYEDSDTTQVRVGYQYEGEVTSTAEAVASDPNYAVCQNDHTQCWPLSHWYGKGDVQEIYFTVDHAFNIKGVTMILEAGAAVYHPTWTETIPDWISSPTATPQLVVVQHDPNDYRITPVVGIGFKLSDNWSAMFQVQRFLTNEDTTSNVPALYSGWAESLTFRYEF